MKSSWKERFARRAPTPAADPARFGSPARLVADWPDAGALAAPQTIAAAETFVRCGASVFAAKRAIDSFMADRRAFIDLPTVKDRAALLRELAACGMVAAYLDGDAEIDVRALRERLGYTREEFALRYGLEVETLRNWEADRRAPDTTARSYLRAIANDPAAVERAYAPPPAA
jgi:putative transcriptional regulator